MPNKSQIFCFSHAGGNAAFFEEIEKDLSDFILVKLEYSGHGKRHKEALYRNFYELADDMYLQLLQRYTGGVYALFGYSMGTISLVEVLKRIIKKNEIPLPNNVFLAAHEPKTKAELSGYTSNELDEWVKQRTIKFGGVPKKLINNDIFWRMYLPLYRADYSIIGEYRFEDLNLKTDIPATIFYSDTDTNFENIKLWKRYFCGECDFYQYEGTHFFIQKHHDSIASIIRLKMIRREIYDF